MTDIYGRELYGSENNRAWNQHLYLQEKKKEIHEARVKQVNYAEELVRGLKEQMINMQTPFDPVLVQRANDSSVAFRFGDSIVQKYKENETEISKMQHLDDDRKSKTIKIIHALRTEELSSQGKAISSNVYGPAVVNSKKDIENFDTVIDKRLTADKFMNSLRANEEKFIISKRKNELVETLKKAGEQGLKEVVINDKTFYKSGKSWTTKMPNERKTGRRSR